MLRILSEKKKRYFYEKNLGSVATVLFEQKEEGGFLEGFTENYIRVVTPFDPLLVNTAKKVRLHTINERGLVEVERMV